MNDSYQKLIRRSREIALLEGTASLLHWDQETGLPKNGIPWRAEELSHLSGLTHRLFTAAEVGGWISDCEAKGYAANSSEAANVRGWRRSYDRATKIPVELVEEHARTTSLANSIWIEARKRSDFSHFAPILATIFDQVRQMADCWGYADSRYDALLEGYEPGARSKDLTALFAAFRPQLVEVLGLALEKSKSAPVLEGDFPIAAQAAFNDEVARAIGFDFDAGRIDATTHPFCTRPGPGDTRLTTRYHTENFLSSLFSVMHEAGHGMYEQGVNQDAFGTPMGSAISLGIHESQSRLWENLVGRTPDFWDFWYPRAAEHFPALRKYTPEEVCAAVNRVSPSFIRVEADQVTYDLHIMLRFELERRMLEGDVALKDLPAVWNEEFSKSFGLKVPDDATGCLQDIHWSAGLIGYFATYSLGNLNGAQLYATALREKPGIAGELKSGHYATLFQWMRDKVHRKASALLPQELMTSITGQPTGTGDHLAMLRAKYS